MEENVVRRFERGPYRDLFDKTCFLTNRPGSGNNWAVGHYQHGLEQKNNITEILRKTAEKCDYLHGFLMLFSLGGGTGSGLGTYILSMLEDQFPSVDRLVSCVHPGSYDDVVTSPYNIAFSLKKLTDHANCVFPVDNKALSDICKRLKPTTEEIPWFPHSDMNSLIVKMLLHVTSGSRFPGPLNVDLNELATNMTPYQGLHYLTSSFSPIETSRTIVRQNELLVTACSPNNQLLRLAPLSSTILAATLLCRGDLSLSACRDYVDRFCKKAYFPFWNPGGIKTGLCSVPSIGVPKSLLLLTNSNAMTKFFREAREQLSMLYGRKAHTHHYLKVDGFEANEFDLADNSMADIIDKYKQSHQDIDIPRLQI